MPNQSVSTTRLVRNLPGVKDLLNSGPVAVTSHGRTEFVVLSQADYERLNRLDGSNIDHLDTKLRLVLGSISTMLFVVDSELRIRRANRSLCNYFKRPPEELVGKTILEVSKSGTFQFVESRCRQVLSTGQEDSFQLASSFRENRLISFLIRPWPNGVIIFADDVTEKADGSERYIRNQALDSTFEALGDFGVGSLNVTGEIAFATRSFAKAVGVTQEQLRGGNFLAMLDPVNRTEISDFLRHTREGTLRSEVRILCEGADYRPALLTLSPYPNMHGGYNFAFAVRLLTER